MTSTIRGAALFFDLCWNSNSRTNNLSENTTEHDVKSVVSKVRPCLDKSGKDAFGSGVSVTVQERH